MNKNISLLTLASDNYSGIHPEVLAAIQNANEHHAIAYGGDPWTKRLEEIFKHLFGPAAESYVVFNGTGANICAIKHLLHSWQAVLCSDVAHIGNDECGAPQAVAGCSLVMAPSKHGKIDPASLKSFLHVFGNQHHAQPGAISITQSTECGTLYTLDELRAIGQFAQERGLLFLMDGARISNAAAALNVSMKEMTTDVGVDVLSFGGTKNGLMGAEAVVFLKPGLSKNFEYVRKQQLQLGSKMRFLSAQLVALLEGDLWLRNASHANAMAKLLEAKLRQNFPQLRIVHPVEVNALFVQFPPDVLARLQKKCFFYLWDPEQSIARLMTGWDMQPEFLDQFIEQIRACQ